MNNDIKYNNFTNQPFIPYKIVEILFRDTSESANNFFKLLKYPDMNCLDKPNLTVKEKKKLIWKGQDIENDYNIFLKPLIGASLDDAEAQTQFRIYRNTTYPISKTESIITVQTVFITNEKTCLVENNGVICERTDLMESEFLNVVNGIDIGVGSGFLSFDRELTRQSNSQLTVNNSRTLYGRVSNLALRYVSVDNGGC